MSGTILALEGIGKSFFGVPAVREVTLSVTEGSVLGLVGQNGAGKSTLMNIIGGVLQPDAGHMRLDGAPYAPSSARDADRAGIAFIHQELNLFTNLTIAENIFLTHRPRGVSERRAAAELLAQCGLDLSPDTIVAVLSPGERQLVEVAKALELDARIIIFDEPTTSLTARETTRLFALIERLKAAGKTIIYISHLLGDVKSLSDDIAVLRDGALVDIGPNDACPVARMISLMLGRDVEQLYPERRRQQSAEVVLETRSLSQRGIVRDVNLSLKRGEVLGLFGLMGSGRTELARMIFGLDSFEHGSIEIGGHSFRHTNPRSSIRARVAFITENRREEGLMMNATVADNIGLAALEAYGIAPLGLVDENRLIADASGLASMLQVKSGPIAAQAVRTLSGGNQQKVVLAKWLLAQPSVLLLDEPTRGIDVAAKLEIFGIIDQLAVAGCGLLFISSEIEELIAMCDRILVMSRGEIVAQFAHDVFDKAAILRAAFREAEAA
jgi:ribose transport system ATP-binding protein